jgi:hypothetical protein
MSAIHRIKLRALQSVILLGIAIGPHFVTAAQSEFAVRGPTIIAFFPPVTQKELESDPDTNETLADFRYYAANARSRFMKAGIDFHEAYALSFRLRLGARVITFRSGKVQVGYYFITPNKKPRIYYGVMTDNDLSAMADSYFGVAPAGAGKNR